MSTTNIPLTPAQLTHDFQALGLRPGQLVMLHASAKAIGDVMGGPNTILQTLLNVLTPAGTLMMYAGWHDIPDYHDPLPDDTRQVYYEQHPAFDPAIARSTRWNGVLVEFLRTWPGTHRSLNPEVSMVAIGAQAAQITQDHPINYGYGAGSPLAKLAALGGSVLILGSPLNKITLLHYAEYCANMRDKRVIHYQCPILQDGKKVWVDVEDYNTSGPHDNYTFEEIALAYLAQGNGQRGIIGNAGSFLFDAADLTQFAIQWLEEHFGA